MHSLQKLNTFGVQSATANLHEVASIHTLEQIDYDPDSWFILGGGSNVLFIEQAPEHVLLINNQGIHYQEHGEEVHVTVAAGVVWHEVVNDSLNKGYSGLENLALIPGKTGAAPIQNIGAYGVELRDRFVSLRAWDLKSKKLVEFDLSSCNFGYRDSYFKSPEGRVYCIWDVTLRLDKQFKPVLGYHGLLELEELDELSAKLVFDEVVKIRQSKLPDPKRTGNAGSFFKNPVIDKIQYGELLRQHPNVVGYPQRGGQWKLAAAWLIDQAGLKGYRNGDAGVHDKQALVIVNHGKASGLELVSLAKKIRHSVHEKFGVNLEPEVNIIGKTGRIELDNLP